MAYDKLIERIGLYYKLATWGRQENYLKALGQTPSLTGTPAIPGSPGTPGARPVSLQEQFKGQVTMPPPAPQTLPETTIKGYPAISPATQAQLNDILIPLGLLVPPGLVPDGEAGPQTQAAMKAFSDRFKVPATPQEIAQMQAKLKEHPELAAKPADVELA